VAALGVAVALLAGCAAPATGPAAQSPTTAASTSTIPVPAETTDIPSAPAEPTGIPASARGPYPVTRVVDGDTIWVRAGGQRVKVRLIGIDTPETVAPGEPVGCFGPEASARAKQLLSGREVYLELDASQGELDRYGRTLAYVWRTDGLFFQLAMVREGFAVEYTYDQPYRYQRELRAAEADARADGRGLWSAC
jgi:micrococcal nuclease